MSQPIYDLNGRTVLVTGASSGLGRRFALSLSGWGAKVVLAARRMDRLHDLVSEINAAGGSAAAVSMDVQDEASVIAGFDAGEAALGPIDTVIANAGMNLEGMAVELAVEDFRKVLDINITGAFLTAREGGRRMIAAGSKQSGRGRVVIIASIGAQKVLPGLAAYCASKAGVAMLGKSLAREWANRGINVNVVCPGYIETEINSEWFQEEGGKKQIATFPRRRLMDDSDLDAVIGWLSSDASRAVTGSVFTVDDGQTL
jgi:NAD(P)-dependent dehydrogenase (short-subunit alcohol dehydrogenase family)